MTNLIEIANDFGEVIWPQREKLKVVDLMLYGGLAIGKIETKDIDILVLHNNPLFDWFQECIQRKSFKTGEEAFRELLIRINDNSLKNSLLNTDIALAISQNKFHTIYMNMLYFSNQSYREKWKKMDQEAHSGEPAKARISEEESFEECIFRQGLLWKSQTERYDTPARTKYQLPTSPQNPLSP